MNDEQLLRYSRQILLPQIDYEGQLKLSESTALIIGLGGLGSPAATYLASSGVGHLIVVDFDTVEVSNLQRQIIHRDADIGRPKVESAADHLREINPHIRVTPVNGPLDDSQLEHWVAQADVVLDCTDNFSSRYAINNACHKQGKPLAFAAAIRMEGQATTFLPGDDQPCYQCLYKNAQGGDDSCARNGVLAPVVGTLGTLQALEAIKVLTGAGTPLAGRLLMFDAMQLEFRTLKFRKDPSCPCCSNPTQ